MDEESWGVPSGDENYGHSKDVDEARTRSNRVRRRYTNQKSHWYDDSGVLYDLVYNSRRESPEHEEDASGE